MAQANLGTIDPSTTSGTDLSTLLSNFDDAVTSGHSGAARPAYALQGMTWTQIVSASQHNIMYYDGDADIEFGRFDVANNRLTMRPYDLATIAGVTAGGDIASNGTYFRGGGKRAIQFSDSLLRLNPDGDFANGIFTPGLIRADGGALVDSVRGIKNVTGDYGTVQTVGAGIGSWAGYNIDGNAAFMSNGSGYGLYDDVNNQWGVLCTPAGNTDLYAGGAVKVTADASGAIVQGRLHATDQMYVGNNGGGDSWIQFYDDNSNTWRYFGWDDSANSFVYEDNAGAIKSIGAANFVELTRGSGWAQNTRYNINHNLGTTPNFGYAFLRCKTSEFGWSAGQWAATGTTDRSNNDGSQLDFGITIGWSSTQAWVKTGTEGPYLRRLDTNGWMKPTAANWEIKILVGSV
ncbi:hypothetical protein [Roseibium aggregatum]|uniref:Uncharacterized protein n=1 Tax=Roseibium aggregatum TaxID=187304 RepID=A0A0M6Y7X5_9HYPH|nr:hypothetical protein [Roseibium aggregatum]CTQ45778.1 hypothetical protein LAL4801_04233 [Roseibium aggregatum]